MTLEGLEAAWWGPAPDLAPTIVLLHEGLGCVALWRDVPERLAALTGCGVLAYSRQGYGASPPAALPRPLTYMHDEALGVLPRVIEAAHLRHFALLGHSDGGSIATIFAGGVSDARLAGAILIAPHFFVEDVSVSSIEAAKTAYETTDLRARLGRYHRDPDNAFRGWNGAWLDPGFRDWRIDTYLPRVTAPLLVLQGEADEYGTAAQLDCAARLAGGAVETMLIPGARHAPHLSHREDVLEITTRFLNETLLFAP
jgi:pimeloyl-ACP methyl ester carboxylesterase